jgi:hypothetical protein
MRRNAVPVQGFSDSGFFPCGGRAQSPHTRARVFVPISRLKIGRGIDLDKRARTCGAKLHTTGIMVKDAVDQIALLDTLPTTLVRRIPGVRLYAPNLRHVDLEAPGYYFLATDTPAVMRWIASEAERAGAAIAYSTAFTGSVRPGPGQRACVRIATAAE